MSRIVSITVLACLFLMPSSVCGVAAAGEKPSFKSRKLDIAVSGKTFCSLKRRITMPFAGVITSIYFYPGQQVRKGDVLVRFRLDRETALDLHRRVSPFHLADLNSRLADLQVNQKRLETNYKQLHELFQEKLTSAVSLKRLSIEIDHINKKMKLLNKRIQQEKEIFEKVLSWLEERLGGEVKEGFVSRNCSLTSPIDGRVLSHHPELLTGGFLMQGIPIIEVGVMDPMLLRASIHEIETMQIEVGDAAEISIESLPGKKFMAEVSQISWKTLIPDVTKPSYYEVQLIVPNPDILLREGFKAQINFRSINE